MPKLQALAGVAVAACALFGFQGLTMAHEVPANQPALPPQHLLGDETSDAMTTATATPQVPKGSCESDKRPLRMPGKPESKPEEVP